MKNFLNRIFGRQMWYTIKTGRDNVNSLLEVLCGDKCIKYERMIHRYDCRFGTGITIGILTTYKEIKRLIKSLRCKMDMTQYLEISIFEEDAELDLATGKKVRAVA